MCVCLWIVCVKGNADGTAPALRRRQGRWEERYFFSIKLTLVHALSGVPVKEGLPPEHGRELLADTPANRGGARVSGTGADRRHGWDPSSSTSSLEHLLHCGGVAHEGSRHLEALLVGGGQGVGHQEGGCNSEAGLQQLLPTQQAPPGSAPTHLGRDVANAALDVVGDPLNKVAAVLVLHIQHLLIHLLGGHAAAE